MHKGERARRPNVVQSVFVFLVVSALAGALVAGLALPLAGLAGVTTAKAHDTVQYLPQDLKTEPLAQKTIIQAADGTTIATLYQENRTPVTLKQISPIMLQAIVAIEDDRFYQHGALDAKGTLRAMLRNQSSGGVQQGGSSITQQYVKLTLINKARTPEEVKAATAETYERKIAELRYAIAVEKQYSKDEILNRYLNLAFFGDRSYGIDAAAMHYFGVHAAKLTLPQAAMLAGLVKNPTGYNPIDHAGRAKERRDVVLRRMQELNVITAKQAQDAIKTPVINPAKVINVPSGCASSRYPFYCDYVVAKLKENPAFGKTPEDAENYIETAGLVIRTSLDPKIQAAAETSIKKHSKPGDQAVAAITMVQPGTGLVKAMAQSRDYGSKKGQTTYNFNVEKSYPGGYGGFQNGSTMKAFTIAAAIGKGVPLTYRINSPQTISLGGKKFSTCTRYDVGRRVQPEQLDQDDDRPVHDRRGPGLDQHLLPAVVRADRPVPDRHHRLEARHVRRPDDEAAGAGGVVHARVRRSDHAADAVERVRDVRRPRDVLHAGGRHRDHQQGQGDPDPGSGLPPRALTDGRRRRELRAAQGDGAGRHRRQAEVRQE